MHLAPPSRRAVGLAAAGAVAMSSAVLVLGGVASAAPAPSWAASGTGDTVAVPAGICTIHWTVTGASGGAAGDGDAGALGGRLEIWAPATPGEVYTLSPGGVGADGVTDGTAAAGGTNASGAGSTQGGAGGLDGSGGGGAASVVQRGGSVHLLAYGGDGGGATGGPGGGDEANAGPWPLDPWQQGPAAGPGAGSITGVGLPCQPLPPYLIGIEPGDGQLVLHFADMPRADPGDPQTVGFEYTIDGGTTWEPLDADPADYESWVTLTGLTNGTPYTVQLRALGGPDTVPSEPSAPRTATPYAPTGAPTNLVVTPGTTTTITWAAPAPVDGAAEPANYLVGFSGGEFGGELCTTAPDVLTCSTTLLRPGSAYTVRVISLDGHGLPGGMAEVSTGVIPFPSAVPTSDGPLQRAGAAGSTVAPGQEVALTGSGYAPNSEVTVLVYSAPQVLATTVADGDGRFSVEVTVPAGLAAGSHTLVAMGVDPAGDPYTLTLPITVSGGTTGAGGLASTGADVAVPAIGGVAALAVGGALILAGRRRRTAE